MFNPNQQHSVFIPNQQNQPNPNQLQQQQLMFISNQQLPVFNTNQQNLVPNPNQHTQLVFIPNQQQLMLIQTHQQTMSNLSQQQLVFNAVRPITGFCSQQYPVQRNGQQQNVLPNLAQPSISASLPGKKCNISLRQCSFNYTLILSSAAHRAIHV